MRPLPLTLAILLCLSTPAAATTSVFTSATRRLDLGTLVFEVAPDGTATVRDDDRGTAGPFPAATFVVTATTVQAPGLRCTMDRAAALLGHGTIVTSEPGLRTRVTWTEQQAPAQCHATDSRQHYTGTVLSRRTIYHLTTKETPP